MGSSTAQAMVPPAIVRAYIADFGGNNVAAAEFAGIPLTAFMRAKDGNLVHNEDHDRLWRAVRQRLGKGKVNSLVLEAISIQPVVEPAVETPTEAVAMRQCTACQKWLPCTNFPQPQAGVFLSRCKPCHSAMMNAAKVAKAVAKTVTQETQTETTVEAIPTLSLSVRLLQLATDAETLETQVAAAGGASAARVTELETEVESLRGLVKQLDEGNAALRERLAAANGYQAENADLMSRIASLTKANADLWRKVDEMQKPAAKG